jgi:hypothetical protein
MPKIVYTEEQGLVQKPGGGVSITSSAAEFTGELSVVGAISPGAGGIMKPAPVILAVTGQDHDLTLAANGGRTNVIGNCADDNVVYILPDPLAAGEYYHFISGVSAADDQKFHITTKTAAAGVLFKGSVTHHDIGETAQTSTAVIANGSSNDFFELDNHAAMSLHFLSLSTSVWYVWGWCASDTACTFADTE